MLEPTYNPMEQPSLIVQLRGILSDYPDNGQIVKEMLQNAEDAKASHVEILYDERCINKEEDENKLFRKFFKGPALCVKNNALFNDEDWKGIKMIGCSVKEKDKLKIGRFGRGFKSVFHLTDYPCIVSGDRILLMDPSRPRNKVNVEMKLKDLKHYRNMDVDAFFLAFSGLPGLYESVITEGYYNGTVFWFPLRERTSEISSTIYDGEKVFGLLKTFEHDSSELFLFLWYLEKVSLIIRTEIGKKMSLAFAEISVNETGVHQRRASLVKSIEKVSKGNHNHEPFICEYEMTINTRNQNGSGVSTKWVIVHYFMGNDCSNRMKELIKDPKHRFCPLVGVAIPVNSGEELFEGHIFCSLPLPRERLASTGLPVHVNGRFSLSQNRHHLKWRTDDQINREIKDKHVLWNEALIEECVPIAYKELMKILLRKANENKNDTGSVERLYRAIPNEEKVFDKWSEIPKQLAKHLNKQKFLFSQGKNRYVTFAEAMFATFENLPELLKHIKRVILDVICKLKTNYVEASRETIIKLQILYGDKLTDLTPTIFADILRQNGEILRKLQRVQKFSILTYLLSGNDYERCLDGIPLLPVGSGNWKTFGSDEHVFVCNSAEAGLFQDCTDCLVIQTEGFSDFIWKEFENMASSS